MWKPLSVPRHWSRRVERWRSRCTARRFVARGIENGFATALSAVRRCAGAYKTAYLAGSATGRNPSVYVRNYKSARGMNWHRDVHDWLGGYPYESANPAEVKTQLGRLGFTVIRSIERPAGIGIFGTGCDEFVSRRRLS